MSNDTLISQELIESVFTELYDLQDFKKIVKGLYKFLRENEYSNNEIRHAFQTFFWNRRSYIELEFGYRFHNVGGLVENLFKNEHNLLDNESPIVSATGTNDSSSSVETINADSVTETIAGTVVAPSTIETVVGPTGIDAVSTTETVSVTGPISATGNNSATGHNSATEPISATEPNNTNEESEESSDSSETNDMNQYTRRIHTVYSGQPMIYDPPINNQFVFPPTQYQTFAVPLNLFGSMLPAQQYMQHPDEYLQYANNLENVLMNNINDLLMHAQQPNVTTHIPGIGTALNFFNIFLNAAPIPQAAPIVKNVLNKEQLNKLLKYEYKDVNKEKYKECSVCLEDYTEENILRILKCEHGFHVDCIDKWLTECDYKCPVCRDDSNEHCHQEEDGTELNTVTNEHVEDVQNVEDVEDNAETENVD